MRRSALLVGVLALVVVACARPPGRVETAPTQTTSAVSTTEVAVPSTTDRSLPGDVTTTTRQSVRDAHAERVLAVVREFHDGFESPPGARLAEEIIPTLGVDLDDPEVLEFGVAYAVACQWYRYWQDALVVEDTETADRAKQKIREVQAWPALVGVAGFWAAFDDGWTENAVDGARAFTDVNCAVARLRLPPPAGIPMVEPTLVAHESVRTEPELDADGVERIVDGWAERGLDVHPDLAVGERRWHPGQLEVLLEHHYWCQQLGGWLDWYEDPVGEPVDLGEAVPVMLSDTDSGSTRRLVIERVIESAERDDPEWAAAEYLAHCFGLDTARDTRVHDRYLDIRIRAARAALAG